MFTGIIEEIGIVNKVTRTSSITCITINASIVLVDTKIGDSIAVNGVCLTVIDINKDMFSVEAMESTIRRTNLGQLRPRHKVNLERSLQASTRLSGHIVTGHINGVGKVVKCVKLGANTREISISAPTQILSLLVSKGSIAVDGISLSIGDVFSDCFTVSLIPHTLKSTTLGLKAHGDSVNIEVDIIAKYVKRITSFHLTEASQISSEFLKEHGFF